MRKPTGITHVAPATTPEVTVFADREIFAPRRRLQRILLELLDNEINARLQSFAFDQVRVWIGHELKGRAAKARLQPDSPAASDDPAIALWLHEMAIELYQDSDYGKRNL
jgi:hypothetical protein